VEAKIDTINLGESHASKRKKYKEATRKFCIKLSKR
jgi:hypothetical protein